MNAPSTPIQQDVDLKKFYTSDGAYLQYSLLPGILSINHVFVPDQLRGQNLAARLVKHAVAHSQSIGTKIRPVCSFAQSYLQAKSEFHTLLEFPPTNHTNTSDNNSTKST